MRAERRLEPATRGLRRLLVTVAILAGPQAGNRNVGCCPLAELADPETSSGDAAQQRDAELQRENWERSRCRRLADGWDDLTAYERVLRLATQTDDCKDQLCAQLVRDYERAQQEAARQLAWRSLPSRCLRWWAGAIDASDPRWARELRREAAVAKQRELAAVEEHRSTRGEALVETRSPAPAPAPTSTLDDCEQPIFAWRTERDPVRKTALYDSMPPQCRDSITRRAKPQPVTRPPARQPPHPQPGGPGEGGTAPALCARELARISRAAPDARGALILDLGYAHPECRAHVPEDLLEAAMKERRRRDQEARTKSEPSAPR